MYLTNFRYKAIALCLGFALIFNTLFAQENKGTAMCGMDASLVEQKIGFVPPVVEPQKMTTIVPLEYAIHFTVVRDVTCSDDRYGVTVATIKKAIDGLNDATKKYFYVLDPTDNIEKPFITFKFGGAKFIIDKDRAYLPDATDPILGFTEDAELSTLSPKIDAIKVYVSNTLFSYARFPHLSTVGQVQVGGSTVGGDPKTTVDKANMIVLSEAKIAEQKNSFERELAHELGHFFSLVHTHQNTEIPIGGVTPINPEFADFTNSTTAGDKLTDTPADPNAKFCMPNSCNVQFCDAMQIDLNPTNPKAYEPNKFNGKDQYNLMGYYYPTYRCGATKPFGFSEQQKMIMQGTKLDFWSKKSGVQHINRAFLANKNITPVLESFHAGEIRKVSCTAPFDFASLTPLKDVTVDIGSFGNKSCKTLPADCGHYVGQNDWASTGIQKILPFKDNDPTNGVTTADLVVIQKHILGTALLTNAYQMIAADANNNGTITTADLVAIRKLILGVTPNISTPSWRFLSQLHENEMSMTKPFADSNPFQSNYSAKKYLAVGGNPSYLDHVDIDYSNQNVAYDPINWSFRGIKVGDVNCSASALLKGGETPDETITTKNNFELIPPNKTLVINVLLNKDVPMEAYQLQLGYDANKVELLKVEQGEDERNSIEDNFNTRERGIIRTVWNSNDDNKLDSKPQYSLFKLHFKTLSEIENPNELLHLSNEDFYNVFYNTNSMTATNTDLTFLATMEENSGGFKVQKTKSNTTVMAYPNPTNNEFYLNIPLAASGNIQIQVLDIVGKMLKNISIEGTEGQNEILINDLNLAGTNMLHYNVQTTKGNYQGKVLITK